MAAEVAGINLWLAGMSEKIVHSECDFGYLFAMIEGGGKMAKKAKRLFLSKLTESVIRAEETDARVRRGSRRGA